MKEEELNDLKYRDLQKVAKENGVKANLPKAGLIEALLEAFEKNKDCLDSVETKIESVPEPRQEENLDVQTENEEKVSENASNSRKNPSRKRDKSKKDTGVQNDTPKEEENLDLSEESKPEKLENQSGNAPKSKRNSKKRNSKTKKESEALNETPKEDNLDMPEGSKSEKKENQPENVPKSKRNSQKRDSEPDSLVEKPSKKAKKSFDTNAFDNELAQFEQLKDKKSFDKNAFDNELAEVEQLTNDLINNIPPRKRSARNSSSVQAATSQIDGNTTKTPETSEKTPKNSVKTPQVEMNKSIQVSRRNSRISRLFDKEAFDIEAAKVSRFAQQIVNSPRKRSSILNLTPVLRGQTASAINSPLVSTMKGGSAINSPLVSAKNQPQNSVKTPLHKMTTAEIYARQNSVKTPLHKRPSMTSAKLTETKKKRSIVMNKPTPGGSVTKAKQRTTVQATGIPRPKVKKVPDFAKLHAKQFGKMDDLDSYLGKKKERMAALTPGKGLATTSQKSPKKNLVTVIPKFGGGGGGSKPIQQGKLQNSPKKKLPVTELTKANFNFGGSKTDLATTSKKPFVFKAKTANPNSPKAKILNNITNKKTNEGQTAGFKPYTGKVKPLPKPLSTKDSLKARQEMAKKVGGKNVKDRQMSHIKGVRMNKRMELMLQKRNVKN